MKYSKGFSLIELMIVVVILTMGLYATLIWYPAYSSKKESMLVVNNIQILNNIFERMNHGQRDFNVDLLGISTAKNFPSSLTYYDRSRLPHFRDADGRRYFISQLTSAIRNGIDNLTDDRQGYYLLINNLEISDCQNILNQTVGHFKAIKTNNKVVSNGSNHYGTLEACSSDSYIVFINY